MIRLERVTYRYPEAPAPALRDVSLRLPEGAFALVVGPSGVGKSTLLRCLNGLVPHFSGGTLWGHISVDGHDPVSATPRAMSRVVGFVFQDPEAQFVMDHVEDEVAFALENAALPRAEMRARVAEVLELLALTPLRDRRLATLSGGEKQRSAIAAALALRPRVLALDEPTSQLDPAAADEVLGALARLNAQLGLTVVLAEHRLERVLPYASHVLYLPERGAPVRCGPPREVLPAMALVPPVVALGRALGWSPPPLTVAEARRLSSRVDGATPGPEPGPEPAPEPAPDVGPFLAARDLEVAYDATPVLRGVDLALHPGEVVALLGPNGAGKTTLLQCLVGLVRPRRGVVRVQGADIAGWDVAEVCRRVGYLPQDPNALLFADTVRDELRITLRNHGIDEADAPIAPAALLARLGLADKAGAYPRDLSAGERQRVALGAVMVTRPGALLLDEPTRGLDYRAKARLLELLKGWRAAGMAILLVTHDVELAAAAADRALRMQAGRIVARGAPARVLRASETFAPQIARLFPRTGWLTVEDALAGLEMS
jgi:energy-coupling factor transport system ATP-binding protein